MEGMRNEPTANHSQELVKRFLTVVLEDLPLEEKWKEPIRRKIVTNYGNYRFTEEIIRDANILLKQNQCSFRFPLLNNLMVRFLESFCSNYPVELRISFMREFTKQEVRDKFFTLQNQFEQIYFLARIVNNIVRHENEVIKAFNEETAGKNAEILISNQEILKKYGRASAIMQKIMENDDFRIEQILGVHQILPLIDLNKLKRDLTKLYNTKTKIRLEQFLQSRAKK